MIEAAKSPVLFNRSEHVSTLFYAEGVTRKQPRVAESARLPWVGEDEGSAL
jgi:hypothetical protein